MVKLLDAHISQNMSISGGISIPVTATPALFGTLGLRTDGAGPNIRVQFTATVAISSVAAIAVPIRISIFRGTGPNAVLIYSATELPIALGAIGAVNRRIITVTGADYRPPNPGSLLVYQAFVSTEGGVAIAPTRTGPESFNAAAYSD
ncbi:hypothetical protein JOC77_000655 [Peribacillus deserti]|uniref:Exosporium protein C n=1 Tax=Peribacillus deserti TaxID=673318 RepID=A0ABS2QDK9_9BACI|nr:hypothetical protein [Peribacillus deserti]MBM7691250.1 hypothetical protein [Peribacillus deserti]